MTGEAIICSITEHIPIEGADRIVQCLVMGETIITQKTTEEGTVGLLFDCETQLDEMFCHMNNLYSDPTRNADTDVKGCIGKNRRVRPIKLRGVRCSGLFMPLDSLLYIFKDPDELEELVNLEGTQLSTVKEQPLCCKYEITREEEN